MTSSQPLGAVLKAVHFENALAIFDSLNFTRTHSSTLSRRISINRYHIGRKKLFSFSNLWRLKNDSTVLKRWVSPTLSFALCKFPLYVSKTISVWLPASSKWPVGLVVWFSLRVREVPGSTPGLAPFFGPTQTGGSIWHPALFETHSDWGVKVTPILFEPNQTWWLEWRPCVVRTHSVRGYSDPPVLFEPPRQGVKATLLFCLKPLRLGVNMTPCVIWNPFRLGG